MRFLRFPLLIPFACLLALIACKNSSTTTEDKISVSRTVSTPAGKSRVIVFVHGIYGSGQSTWKSEEGSTYWPDLMRTDPQFSDADVVVTDYLTSVAGNLNDVKAIADSLGRELASQFASHKEVIFVCHSLGGLVVKELLLDNPKYAQKIPFIVFYATPGMGSFVARFASVFSDDPLLDAMSNAGDNTYLLQLEGQWRKSKFRLHRYCAYEELKMRPHDLRALVVGGTADAGPKLLDFVGGIYVVDPFSATYGCDTSTGFTGIHANHVGIVKPNSRTDPSYALFAKYYASNGSLEELTPQPLKYDKTLCAFYGEANQGSTAWNQDEICPVSDKGKLDPDFHQGDFHCCGGSAGSPMTNASIPAGLEIQVDGGHYWSVSNGSFQGDSYVLHTYCGPERWPGPGCNVKVKIVGHYKIIGSDNRNTVQ